MNLVIPKKALQSVEAKSTNRRELQKSANRDAILVAATAVFTEMGYEAANVRDIIRRTQLASGTFYNYFKSKEEVFDALHDNAILRFKPLLREINISAKGDIKKFVRSAYLGYFQFVMENKPFQMHAEKTKGYSRARFDTPESMVLFDEIKGYLLKYVQDYNLTDLDYRMLTASCIGVAQEISECILRDANDDLESYADFATAFVLGGISRLK